MGERVYRSGVRRNEGGGRRLLIVSDTLSGGTGGAVLGHAQWFQGRGWQVEIAAPAGESDAVSVTGHRPVAMPESVRHLGAVVDAARRVHQVVTAFRPDVVHCHGARSFTITRLATGRRSPFVTLHSISPVSSDPPGYARLRRPGLALLPLLAAGAFAVRPDAPRRWEFLPHASPRLTSMGKLPPPAAPVPTFLWIGRLDEPKRPDLFVRSISALASERPHVRGVMAGAGPLEQAVARDIADSGAPIELLGHVSDLSEALLQAWAVVLFSGAEGVNFALEEAMWAGRAIIGSAIPGTAWLVGSDGAGGRVVDSLPSSVQALREFCQPERARDVGERAAVRIRGLLRPDDPWPAIERAYGDHHARGGPAPSGADPHHR